MSIAVKIGLRTTAKAPVVTSSVRSVASTPTRQEAPIPAWEASTPRKPRTVMTKPAQAKTSECRGATTIPVRARVGEAAPSTSAAAKRIPPHHPAEPAAPLIPRKPVEPVRARWSQDRTPNAATRPIRYRPSARAGARSLIIVVLLAQTGSPVPGGPHGRRKGRSRPRRRGDTGPRR